MKLLSFHNDPEVKQKYIARVKAHQKADRIIKGQYWENGKGCAVGCTIEGSDHSKYEKELGIPEVLACLEDGLFEDMSNKRAMKFPLEFLEAIPVGVDLSDVFKKLMVWEWRDEKYGLSNIKEIKDDKELYDCCEAVTVLYERTLAGEKVETKEWVKLEKLADRIYGSWSWARARAGAGAWAWAEARAWAGAGDRARAWVGSRAGARSWARSWARVGAEYEKQIEITADKLLELLREAPSSN